MLRSLNTGPPDSEVPFHLVAAAARAPKGGRVQADLEDQAPTSMADEARAAALGDQAPPAMGDEARPAALGDQAPRDEAGAAALGSQASRRTRGLPDLLTSVKLKYVKLGYRGAGRRLLLLVALPAAALLWLLSIAAPSSSSRLWEALHYNLVSVLACTSLLVFCATIYFLSRPRPVYLLDFACYKPPDNWKCSTEEFIAASRRTGAFSEESIAFQRRISERSGLGDETYLPPVVFQDHPRPSMELARQETELVLESIVGELLSRNEIASKDVGILVVNCSLFSPTPSLTAFLVNRFKLRSNITSFNLSGMGCSAGVIAINLASDLLQVHTDQVALVVSTESITLNWYHGNDRAKLLPNCIFRVGGAAVLLSNRNSDGNTARYRLFHAVRSHKGADDASYGCVFQDEDLNGKMGVTLSKDLMAQAGEALKTNITTLGPLILPVTEQAKFFSTLLGKRLFGSSRKIKPYIPDFKLAVEHFCIHAGGRAVLDAIQSNLRLAAWHMEPSRMTLHRFGNTSSSSLWYELAYAEAKGRIVAGDRVWQIAFGSGFKCNSAVWVALRGAAAPAAASGPWADCIQRYPVKVLAETG